MNRQDHTFLFTGAEGSYGMAFCPTGDISAADARGRVEIVLAEAAPGSRLAYLGLLDYRGMDEWAAEMLEPFDKHGKVWLAWFAEKAG